MAIGFDFADHKTTLGNFFKYLAHFRVELHYLYIMGSSFYFGLVLLFGALACVLIFYSLPFSIKL